MLRDDILKILGLIKGEGKAIEIDASTVYVTRADSEAAALLKWLYDEMSEDATVQDLHNVLDAAKWWATFFEAVRANKANLPESKKDD